MAFLWNNNHNTGCGSNTESVEATKSKNNEREEGTRGDRVRGKKHRYFELGKEASGQMKKTCKPGAWNQEKELQANDLGFCKVQNSWVREKGT